MTSRQTSPEDRPPYDTVFLNSRREAIIIFCVWAAGLFWAVPFCYFHGYIDDYDPQTFTTTLGVPTWLFWGIVVPWLVADVFTTWFCLCYMKDDDLGQAADELGSDEPLPGPPSQEEEAEC